MIANESVLAGRYVIERELGRGGMGAVYQALDRELSRRVALKVIAGGGVGAPELMARFVAEARATAQLEHPGIVPVHDAGRDEHGRLYFTMKLVEGRTLASVIQDARAKRGDAAQEYTLFRLLEIVGEVARAVAYAHERGFLHRDLKPQNVMLGRYGEVQVMDWGLVKVLAEAGRGERAESGTGTDDDAPRRSMRADEPAKAETAAGVLIGTPAFMSPEQTVGDPALIGPLSDVFALGALLYYVLTGGAPYAARTSADVLALARRAAPRRPREVDPAVPEEVEAICLKAMAPSHVARYPTAKALADDIQAYLEHRPVLAQPPTALQQVRLLWRRNRPLARALAVSALVVVALTAAYVVRLQRERRIATARLDEVLRLADVKRLADYEREAAALWPARPGTVPALEAWLLKARALADRTPLHRAKLAELAAPTATADGETLWERETLAGLVAGLERFAGSDPASGAIASVEARFAFARTLKERTIDAYALDWREAAAAVAAAPRHGGLVLRPQVGLIPLGRDPASGLEEFADLATGAPPVRGPDGRLALREDTGVVLVLLPGGRFRMGAAPPVLAETGETNLDPASDEDERPPHDVVLAPFFMAKHEMTQGQWLRLAGSNPSQVPAGTTAGERLVTLLHPVEGVSFEMVEAVLARAGMRPPTEAQWEYAARAGTRGPWFTGDDPRSIAGAANLADEAARRHGLSPGRPYEDWLEDGHAAHAPVGSFRPNAFGLHDTAGNVWEWCDDVYGPYEGRPARAGDGRRPVEDPTRRVSRGGCYERPARDARSARRHWDSQGAQDEDLGVRPARALE